MVDFKFNAVYVSLHREPSEVGLVEKLFGSLYWWVELGMGLSHYFFSRHNFFPPKLHLKGGRTPEVLTPPLTPTLN